MNDVQLNSLRKRINQKIRQIVMSFGIDSTKYKKLETFIKKSPLTYHIGNLKGSDSGVIQISGLSKSKNVSKSAIQNILLGADRYYGVREARNIAKRQLKEEGVLKPKQEMITKRAKENEFISMVLTDEKKSLVYQFQSTKDFFQTEMRGNKGGNGDQKKILEIAKKIDEIDFSKKGKNLEDIIPQTFDD